MALILEREAQARQEVAQQMADEMRAANRDAINTKGFELEAERVGRPMRDSYRIGFIDVGGWDTHVGEGAAQGNLAGNLAGLGRGLQAFAQSLGGLFRSLWGLSSEQGERIFQQMAPVDLKLV
jgi:uncharacterized protein (DUF1501 family)